MTIIPCASAGITSIFVPSLAIILNTPMGAHNFSPARCGGVVGTNSRKIDRVYLRGKQVDRAGLRAAFRNGGL